MLRRALSSVDAVGESHPIKLLRIIPAKTLAGNKNFNRVVASLELAADFQLVGIAKFMCIFGAEARDLASNMPINSFRQEKEMMAEAGVESRSLDIARVDE